MYAIIENGEVVGLTETDISALTTAEVVECDASIKLKDKYAAGIFTPAPEPKTKLSDNEISDSFTFSTDNYYTDLTYYLESVDKVGTVQIRVMSNAAGGIQYQVTESGGKFSLIYNVTDLTLSIQNKEGKELTTFVLISESSYSKPGI